MTHHQYRPIGTGSSEELGLQPGSQYICLAISTSFSQCETDSSLTQWVPAQSVHPPHVKGNNSLHTTYVVLNADYESDNLFA